MHKGSLDTYSFIADFVAPDFYHSKKDKWYRMGFLGAFGDMVMSCLPVGAIAEIGCGESSIYLSNVARKYNRDIFHCDIAHDKIINPLTVPGYMYPEVLSISEKNRLYNYKNSHFYMGDSDSFFTAIKQVPLALTFIDGDHNYPQAKKDFDNAVAQTIENGYIILHDTYPPSEAYTEEHKCGDVFKLRQEIEKDERFDSLTLTQGVAMDVGMTLVRVKQTIRPYFRE